MNHYWGLEHCWFQNRFQALPDRTRAVQDQRTDTTSMTHHCGLCMKEKILSWEDKQGSACNFKHKLNRRREKEKVGSSCCGSLRRVRTKKHISKLELKRLYFIRFFIPYNTTTEFIAHYMKAPNTSLCQRQIFGLCKPLLQNNLAIFTLPYFR